jgi:hypothetical protein
VLVGTDEALELIDPAQSKPTCVMEFAKLELVIKPVSLFGIRSKSST